MLYIIYMYISRSRSLETSTVKCFHSTRSGRCQSTFLGCCIYHMAKISGKGGGLVTVFIVIHRSIHLLSLETNTIPDKDKQVHVLQHGISTLRTCIYGVLLGTPILVLMILGPAVHHTYECCWSTADGEDAEPAATEWAGTVWGHAL